MGFQRCKIHLCVANTFFLHVQVYGHGLTKNGKSLLQINNGLFVHKSKCAFSGR